MNMRLHHLLFLLTCMCWTHGLFSQEISLSDRVLMKDSTELRGRIMDIRLHEYVIIRLIDGQKLKLSMDAVERITRKQIEPTSETREKPKKRDRLVILHQQLPKAYFGQLHLNAETNRFGVLGVNGYRFSPWHQLGVGFGFSFTGPSYTFIPTDHNGHQDRANAIYAPLYLQYGGNGPSPRKVLYYSLELGYAFRLAHIGRKPGPLGIGGIHIATEGGVRFKTHTRYNFRLGLRFSFLTTDLVFREYSIDAEKGILQLHDVRRTVGNLFFGLSFIHTFGR